MGMTAWDELQEMLTDGEQIEAVVLGDYGWGGGDELGYGEPSHRPVPLDKRGVVLTADEAKPLMQDWQLSGGFGAPSCYAATVWTNRQVIWVHEYDGSTGLESAPRHPAPGRPRMS